MKQIRMTRHALRRIMQGDKHGPRTALTVEEVVELARSPFAIKDGRMRYIYSPVDEKTLTLVTAREGSTIITIYDTSRQPNRLVDMLARKRAGVPFTFTPTPDLPELSETDKATITLGTYRTKKEGSLRTTDLVDLGEYHGLTPRRSDVVESEGFHRLLVDGTNAAWNEGRVSKTAMRRLYAFIYAEEGDFGMLPLWVSFGLLGEPYPI